MAADSLNLAEKAVRRHGAAQRCSELEAFGRLLVGLGCRSLLELGTGAGGTSWYFAALGLSVTTIDLDHSQVREPVAGVRYQQGDSHRLMTCCEPADAVFIDGDHSYEGCQQDFEQYGPRAGKLIALHDIIKHPTYDGCQVDRFWATIKPGRAALEIYNPAGDVHPDEGATDWGGIGVLLLA